MILFLNGEYPFCYYYRGYLPAVYSNQLSVQEFITRGSVDTDKLIQKASQADVIVFQRPTNERLYSLALNLKAQGKKIIFENDDTYKGIPLERLGNATAVELAKRYAKNIEQFLKISDGVIASTEILAKEYAEVNPNVVVLKNTIDPLDEFPCKENTTGKFRVGFIGSVTSNDDYEHIKDQIQELDKRGDITLVVLGVKTKDGKILPTMMPDYQFWASLKNVEWHPYVHVTEYMSTLANLALDVALIPRKEHYFNQCKSNLKFLEMSLLKIPVIAQGFSDGSSPYQGVDSEYMTIAFDKWYDEVIKAKDNYSNYKNLALKAHDYVLENYNIKSYAPQWVYEINKLIK
jgi:hypothetical protein